MITPNHLFPGATIGIAAPSGLVRDKEAFIGGVKLLHELGYQTKFPSQLWPGDFFLSDTDDNRVKEFHQLWFDVEVDAVMAARGGYGCLRIVDSLDYRSLASTPKLLIGFSDISLLHNCIQSKCGMITLHGPVVTSLGKMEKESVEQFLHTLNHDLRSWEYKGKIEMLRGSSSVIGTITGGNLSTIISTLGTPLQPSWDNKIVFLEDTAEHVYRIDKMLTQLKLARLLDNASAFVLGDFSHGLGLDRNERLRHHEYIWKRLLELTAESIPVWAEFPMGHGKQNFAVPMGMKVILNNKNTSIAAV